jgi:hypothetical protein
VTAKNGVEFARKLGIVAAAIIAVGTIVSYISGKAWVMAMQPIVTEWRTAMTEERYSRQLADSVLSWRMKRNERDRLDLLEMLMTPQDRRAAKAAEIRLRWKAQNGHGP